ncbi:MAG TPA: ROK family protein [Crocinitomicaceae bacterium]|nr:ROK family protein [Crocinitomicaceae bacterium]
MEENILGIDIGGTNIKIGIVRHSGEIIYQNSFPINAFETPETLVNQLYTHLKETNFLSTIAGIGIGAPNGNCFHGTIDFAPNLPWKGIIPLCELFEQKFGKKTMLSNDANATAIGENIFGAGKKYNHFVLITLGTGLGSGIVVNNKLILGANGYAGEFGHIRVIPNGRLCKCGRKGCLETYASATGIVRTFHELKEKHPTSTLLNYENVTSKIIFETAQQGDVFANEIINFTAQLLGNALADFACFSDPQAYILFGGMTHSNDFFTTKVQHYMDENLLEIFKTKINVERSQLKDDDAALLGAVAVYLDRKTR